MPLVDVNEHIKVDEDRKKVSSDMAVIRDMWCKHISASVPFSYLNKVLYGLLKQGVSSDYMVFVMQYIVKNHCRLNHPPGFRYYVDDTKIKAEYGRKMRKTVPMNQFKAAEPQVEEEGLFPTPQKMGGFERILTGG